MVDVPAGGRTGDYDADLRLAGDDGPDPARDSPQSRPPDLLAATRRYYPGPVMWMGVAMGVGVGISTTFMADFAREMQRAEHLGLLHDVLP